MHLVTEWFSPDCDWVTEKIDLNGLSLPWLSRWYLGRDNYKFEGGTIEDLRATIIVNITKVVDSMFDTIDYPPITNSNYSATIRSLVVLIEANLDAILLAINGEKSPKMTHIYPRKTPIFMRKADIHWLWISRNTLFHNNLRLFLQNFFYERLLVIILEDVIVAENALQNGKLFEELTRKYAREIEYFSHESVRTSDIDDVRQEWLLTLWACVKQYKGQNFIPFRAYFLRALRNKKIDIIRGAATDKRCMQIHARSCPFLNWETYIEQEVSKAVYRSWEQEYLMWINSSDSLDDTPFEWARLGALWYRTGKSPSEIQIEQTLNKLFQLCCDSLFWRLKHELHQRELDAFHYCYKNGEAPLKRIVEEKFGNCALDWLTRFFRTFWFGKIWFDGEAITIIGIDPDLEQIFTERVKWYIQYDTLILYHIEYHSSN